jgi:hypothetical protein
MEKVSNFQSYGPHFEKKCCNRSNQARLYFLMLIKQANPRKFGNKAAMAVVGPVKCCQFPPAMS